MPVTKPVAIVGVGAIMPDAADAASFWANIKTGVYSIRDVPPERWDPDLYYDPDPSVPDKTYTKIGGWVRDFKIEPLKWGIAIPPRVLEQMDGAQQWAIAAAREALLHYGFPGRKLDQSRTAVILGNALGGEKHYNSTMRIRAPEFVQALAAVPAFQGLPKELQQALLEGMKANIRSRTAEITEDTMPGELGNIIAGRVANVFNFQGPNFITDAACASSLAAVQAAVEGLNNYQFDSVITGGVDRMMGVEGFVKFCKIGALSPDGSRPYADGANGFVMGEGAALFLMKRLEDAERDGDTIYAVVRGIGSSSDGKGKGITAPNPTGQQQAIERAWKNAGLNPATVGLIEGHGTSTRVGDVVEVNSLNAIFGQFGLPAGSIALGSVKSNIGHLKSAAGAAGLFKVTMALHEKVLPPSVNFERPNPNIDFKAIPFRVNTQLTPWEVKQGEVRRAGVSSFGFGGTNFHLVVDEYIPGVLTDEKSVYTGVTLAGAARQVPEQPAVPEPVLQAAPQPAAQAAAAAAAKPYRGLFFISAETSDALRAKLASALEEMRAGRLPPSTMPAPDQLALSERLAIDYGDAEELIKRAERALKGFETEGNPWQALVAHGVFRGSGAPGKVTFLFPGQGSQYVNMLKDLCEVEPIVAETFAEADRVMTPILGRPLTSFIYVDGDEAAVAEAEKALRNTEITQPAMLTANVALLRLMNHFGFHPDMVIGHSLGEYAALVAAGVLTFAEALEVVSARGREMKKVSWEDNGCMAAVSAPLEKVENILKSIDGYVVLANINSPLQSVIGGTTDGVEKALVEFQKAGFQGTKIPVSHAFHTKIVAPASEPLREVIARMNIQPPKTTVVANVTGEVYPTSRDDIIDILAQQVAAPVQFVKGMQTLYNLGGRVFVEVGPKRVLNALATDNLKGKNDVAILATNHPREGAVVSFNKALCGILAAGVMPRPGAEEPRQPTAAPAVRVDSEEIKQFVLKAVSEKTGYPVEMLDMDLDLEADLGVDTVKQAELFASIRTHYDIPRREDLRLSDYNTLAKVVGFMEDALGQKAASGQTAATQTAQMSASPKFQAAPEVIESPAELRAPALLAAADGRLPLTGSVVISGAGLGLPGKNGQVFDDGNIRSILNGEIRIEPFPEQTRASMLDKRVTRLIKSEAGAVMQVIDQMDQTVKLGGQRGAFDLADEFGVPADRVEATDISTQLAIAAGIEALRDAGIPLVMAYRQTSKGTYLPDRWKLPEALADETGVVFGSAFPGLDEMAKETGRYYQHKSLEKQIAELRALLDKAPNGSGGLREVIEARIRELQAELDALDYQFDRRFVFRILSMGHSQFAEYIGARGPNTHVNAACATTTHAVAVAEDWIRTGRARRVVVIAGDDVTSGDLANWVGTGLMASGAATTEGDPRMAILPFDRRRNGLIMGMGAAALVLESEDAVRERGMRGIAEVLATQIANSAYHGTRLDVQHVSDVMERLVSLAEHRFGLRRDQIASKTVFVSHETYTPARGGSAAAEIRALRQVFGGQANQVVIANTKGYTGHTMGVGVEDVVAVKALEMNTVPPIANIHNGFEPDPDLGDLRLSRGGSYDVEYALRLGAGFGSQIAMTLLHKIPGEGARVKQETYQKWLASVAGYEKADLVVEKRTLRIRHAGPPVVPPARSAWQFGQGPTLWASDWFHQGAGPAAEAPKAPASAPLKAAAPAAEPETKTTPVQASAGVEEGEIKRFVLQAVSEKTGYPVEMLDLDLDLEADLGIDTVKQAELFATIRTHFNIPRREDLRLADYNTLAKVIGFMQDALGQSGAAAPVQEAPSGEITSPAPAAATAGDVEEIKAFVLQAVSEKTGYPVEMLDLDLDLEADLGIDTVKQAELFATIRTHFNIPRREDLRLADYNTLAKVIGFMQDALAQQPQHGAGQPGDPAAVDRPMQTAPSVGTEATQDIEPKPAGRLEQLLQAAPEQTVARRVPVPVLLPRLDLCMPTGVQLGAGSRVLVISDLGQSGARLAEQLSGLGAEVMLVDGSDPAAAARQAAAFAGQGAVQGVYFLPALDAEPALSQMDTETWQKETDRRASGLFEVIRAAGGEPFLVCATRMGGLFGYEPGGALAPLGGLVSGFTKALALERPDSLVKVVDFEPNAAPEEAAKRLVAETLGDPSVVEVGWKDGLRFAITVEEEPAGEPGVELAADNVYVISGGSGGITAPVVLDLAKHAGGTFYLLSRTPLPPADEPDLKLLMADRNAFKAEMGRRLREAGEKATPAVVDQKIAALERAAATLEMMEAAGRAGARVKYLTCDVTDPAACRAAIESVLAEAGKVDVLIHAAGVERSRKLDTKPLEEFKQIVSVKADGFFNLYRALRERSALPKAVIFFSSIAGRFGNSGQTDYAAANDLLAKLATSLSREHPGMQALCLDWGAWSEVGMASRGYIPELMKRAGIEMLHPAAAAPLVRRELKLGQAGGEILLAGSLGLMAEARRPDGALDLEKANRVLTEGKPAHALLTSVTGYSIEEGVVIEAELDPNTEPFLRDHALNGIPLLPGVMGIEGLSTASRQIASALASERGSFKVTGLENIQFLAAFKFYRNQPRKVTWKARVVREGDGLVAYASLESTLTRYGRDPERMLHFTGKVHLAPKGLEKKTVKAPAWTEGDAIEAEDIYKLYFHGPSFRVLEAVKRNGNSVLGKLQPGLPPIVREGKELTTQPVLVELCLQTAGVWEIGATGTMALPRSIGSLNVYRTAVNGAEIFAEVTRRNDMGGQPSFDARVVDAKGRVYLEMENYRTEPLPYSVEKEQLSPLQSWLRESKE